MEIEMKKFFTVTVTDLSSKQEHVTCLLSDSSEQAEYSASEWADKALGVQTDTRLRRFNARPATPEEVRLTVQLRAERQAELAAKAEARRDAAAAQMVERDLKNRALRNA